MVAHAPSLAQPGLAAEIAHVDGAGPSDQHVLARRGGRNARRAGPRRAAKIQFAGQRRGRACHPAQERALFSATAGKGDGVVAGMSSGAVLRHAEEVRGHERPAREGSQAQRPLRRAAVRTSSGSWPDRGRRAAARQETRVAEACRSTRGAGWHSRGEDGEGGERARGPRGVRVPARRARTEDRDRQHAGAQKKAVARRRRAVEQRRTGQEARRSAATSVRHASRGQGALERGAAGDRVRGRDRRRARHARTRSVPATKATAVRPGSTTSCHRRPVPYRVRRLAATLTDASVRVLAQLALRTASPAGHREDAGHGQVGRCGAPPRHHGTQPAAAPGASDQPPPSGRRRPASSGLGSHARRAPGRLDPQAERAADACGRADGAGRSR